MTTLNYKHATRADLKRIVEIYNSTIPTRMVTADTEPVTVESRQKWFEEHNLVDRPLWMVENADQEMIGWEALS